MTDSFHCPHCGARLRGTFDGRERKCPKCERPITKEHFLNAKVPEAALPASSSSFNPLIVLAVSIALQLFSLLSLASSSTILTVVLSAGAIASLVTVVVSVKQDRESAILNYTRAQDHLQASRQNESLHKVLREQFVSLLEEHQTNLSNSMNREHSIQIRELEDRKQAVGDEKRKLKQERIALKERESEVGEILDRLGAGVGIWGVGTGGVDVPILDQCPARQSVR